MKVRFASPAERELKEAVEFYKSAQKGLGADFLAEVEAATRLMESHPLAWTPMSPRKLGVAGCTGFRLACSIRCGQMRY